MIKTVILGALGLLIAFSLSVMYRLGVFKEVSVSLSEPLSLRLLSKEHVGPYHKIVPVIEEVEAWAKARDLDCSRSFGEYLDDPRLVEEVRLKSRGGCILEQQITDYPSDFIYSERPARKYIEAQFSGGPSIGPYKVYPKMLEFAQEHRLKILGPVIEIYQGTSDQDFLTTYLMSYEE